MRRIFIRQRFIVLVALLLGACEPALDALTRPCNCPDGCCDAAGVCQRPISNQHCGALGGQCATCAAGETCDVLNGRCGTGLSTCGASCTGCCDALTGQCKSGNDITACGLPGQQCQACSAGQTCQSGSCSGTPAQCDASCAGCCDSFGRCQLGTSEGACGAQAASCLTCSAGQYCQNGQCVSAGQGCNASNCANGCCDSAGNCQTASSNQNCGTGGQFCKQCASGQTCVAGQCACNAQTCPNGCCDGGICRTGQDANACGVGGQQCSQCDNGRSCQNGSCTAAQVCNAATCSGCCQGTRCITNGATNAQNCGTSARQCRTCWSGEVCDQGTCNNPAFCNAFNCPNGCCIEGRCQTFPSDGACGTFGNVCAQCAAFQSCFGGVCVSHPQSFWGVGINFVQVDPRHTYDLDLTPPDIYVEVWIDSPTSALPARSVTVQNEYDARSFGGPFFLTNAGELTSFGLRVRIHDEDSFWFDETIGDCLIDVNDMDLTRGSVRLVGCPGIENINLRQFEVRFVPHLQF